MSSNEGCSEGTPGPNYDSQSTVCLLDPKATDEPHNLPPAPEGSEPEIPTNVQNDPGRRWSSSELQVIVLLFLFIVLAFLASFALAFYMLYIHVHYRNLLQTLTERLDAQSHFSNSRPHMFQPDW